MICPIAAWVPLALIFSGQAVGLGGWFEVLLVVSLIAGILAASFMRKW
jgi:hypothetical protein